MPKLEIKPEEIGSYDYVAVKARRARLWQVRPPREMLAVTLYEEPIGPQIVDNEERRKKIERASRPPTPCGLSFERWRVLVTETCEIHGLNKAQLFSNRRAAKWCLARHELWWTANKYIRWSLPQMGRASGGRDHTTVLHGVRTFQRKLDAGIVTAQLLPNLSNLPLFMDESDPALDAIAAE